MDVIDRLAAGVFVLLVAACGGTTATVAAGAPEELPPGSPPLPPSAVSSSSCSGATAVTFGSGEGIPSAVVVDDARVYWLTHAGAGADGGVKLRAAPKCGGAAVTLATGPYFAEGLAQDDATLFFATIGAGQGAILSVPKSGGAAVTLKHGDFRPSGIAVDSASIYWADAYESAVYKMPKTGGATTLLATGLSPNGLTSPQHVVVQGEWVYAAGQAGLASIPKDGGTPKLLFGQPIADLRATGNTLLLASWAGVFSVSLVDGGTLQLADGASSACVSGAQVAFVRGDVVELHRVPLAGGTDDILASGAKGPGSVACDAAAVYWAASGQITRTALR